MQNSKRFITEAVGTCMLVFITAGLPIMIPNNFLAICLGNGLIVLSLIYALGHVSGAHFNPAVTLAFASIGKFPKRFIAPYIFAQCFGAILGAVILFVLFPYQIEKTIVTSLQLAPGISNIDAILKVLLTEILLSFIFMTVIMGVATDKRAADPAAAGLPIGFTVVVLSLFAAQYSGAALNPARVLGPHIISGSTYIAWPYYIATIIGSIGGACFYQYIRNASAPRGNDFGLLGPIK